MHSRRAAGHWSSSFWKWLEGKIADNEATGYRVQATASHALGIPCILYPVPCTLKHEHNQNCHLANLPRGATPQNGAGSAGNGRAVSAIVWARCRADRPEPQGAPDQRDPDALQL